MESKMGYSSGPSGSPIEVSNAQFVTSKYIRNSKAVGILWAVFTVCSAVLNVVVFISEHWVGDTDASKGPGHFGLWRFCTVLSAEGDFESKEGSVVCIGDLNNFSSILSPAFRASTVFVGLSVIVIVLCVLAFLLFCFMKSNSVFEICGTMQFLSGICIAIGILAFPAGWDNEHVRSICGIGADDYNLGSCGVRWAFVLAIIAFFDCWILGCLAFTLAHRTVRPQPVESHYMNPGSLYKGEVNNAFVGDTQSLTGSRKSTSLQPVMMMPHPGGPPPQPLGPPDGFSDLGQGRPNQPYGRSPYPPGGNIQNFQL